MVAAQRTSVEALRRELKLRFQDELENGVQGPTDILTELVVDPVEASAFPLFFQKILSRGKDAKNKKNNAIAAAFQAGRRVPSRSEGAALPSTLPVTLPFVQPCFNDSLPCPSFPPHTSRGVTIPKETETTIIEAAQEKILGGYDGGVEVGFNGEWSPLKFKTLCQILETAKTAAENQASDERFVQLGDMTFAVYAHGANCGAHYKYVIEGNGIKIYIHANPKGPIQPIRLRYGFEAIAGRDLFAVHINTLEWLKEIGFTIQKECVSRVDLQVMLFRSISELMTPIFDNRSVKRASKYQFHGKGNKPVTSFTLGSMIQLCIYDKRQELIDTCDEVKMSLIVNDCLAGEFPDELTRIEYRLRRDALRYFGINTIQDLLEREHALVDYLTFDWFRLLNDEKDRSNSALQELAPIWQEVRDLFFEYFPGPVENRKPLDGNADRREVKCTGEALIKQAMGCFARAASLAKGVIANDIMALRFIREVVAEKIDTFLIRVREMVAEMGVVRGAVVPKPLDWYLDPQYAGESSEDVLYEFRVVFDEDLQYDRFTKVAVTGCPF